MSDVTRLAEAALLRMKLRGNAAAGAELNRRAAAGNAMAVEWLYREQNPIMSSTESDRRLATIAAAPGPIESYGPHEQARLDAGLPPFATPEEAAALHEEHHRKGGFFRKLEQTLRPRHVEQALRPVVQTVANVIMDEAPLIAAAVATSFVAPQIIAAMTTVEVGGAVAVGTTTTLAASTIATTTIGETMLSGAVYGSTFATLNSVATGDIEQLPTNVLKGAVSGAMIAAGTTMICDGVSTQLSAPTVKVELTAVQEGIIRGGVVGATTTVVYGGDLGKNMLASVAAEAIASTVDVSLPPDSVSDSLRAGIVNATSSGVTAAVLGEDIAEAALRGGMRAGLTRAIVDGVKDYSATTVHVDSMGEEFLVRGESSIKGGASDDLVITTVSSKQPHSSVTSRDSVVKQQTRKYSLAEKQKMVAVLTDETARLLERGIIVADKTALQQQIIGYLNLYDTPEKLAAAGKAAYEQVGLSFRIYASARSQQFLAGSVSAGTPQTRTNALSIQPAAAGVVYGTVLGGMAISYFAALAAQGMQGYQSQQSIPYDYQANSRNDRYRSSQEDRQDGLYFSKKRAGENNADGKNRERPHAPDPDKRYISPPAIEEMTGFSDAIRVRAKNDRPRWHLPKGKMLEWDHEKGEFEMYDKTGKEHKGSYDPSGRQRSLPNPSRKTAPR